MRNRSPGSRLAGPGVGRTSGRPQTSVSSPVGPESGDDEGDGGVSSDMRRSPPRLKSPSAATVADGEPPCNN